MSDKFSDWRETTFNFINCSAVSEDVSVGRETTCELVDCCIVSKEVVEFCGCWEKAFNLSSCSAVSDDVTDGRDTTFKLPGWIPVVLTECSKSTFKLLCSWWFPDAESGDCSKWIFNWLSRGATVDEGEFFNGGFGTVFEVIWSCCLLLQPVSVSTIYIRRFDALVCTGRRTNSVTYNSSGTRRGVG